MPVKQKQFIEQRDDLTKAIDVDASDGRSVPINMNFVDTGFLTKDSGFTLAGAATSTKAHSLFHYKKKDGTSYFIRGNGTKLQVYSFIFKNWTDIVGSPTFTENAEFGYIVYDDVLYFGNAVESMYTFDGTTFTEYASAPKGNIFEVFEDRICIAGVLAEPLTVYYSNVGDGTVYTSTDVLKPLGTDSVTNLKNYYGSLLIFKRESIWKVTFIFDQVVSLFVPKIESQSGTYGACSRKAVFWVENDIWFFTGSEVRAIGLVDNISGNLGINKTVISEPIKETLKLIDLDNLSKVVAFYHARRFYLCVPLTEDENDTIFVCHTLYSNSWTKYSGRDKSQVNSFAEIDDIIYTTTSLVPYGTLKWTVEASDQTDTNYTLTTES